jgi:hypothetical protein
MSDIEAENDFSQLIDPVMLRIDIAMKAGETG